MYVHVVVLLGVLRQREVTPVGMQVVAGQGTRPAGGQGGEGGISVIAFAVVLLLLIVSAASGLC